MAGRRARSVRRSAHLSPADWLRPAPTFFHVDASPVSSELAEAIPDVRALFTARVDAQSRAMVGATLELAVDPRRFHFFDPETGARLSTSGAPVLAGA